MDPCQITNAKLPSSHYNHQPHLEATAELDLLLLLRQLRKALSEDLPFLRHCRLLLSRSRRILKPFVFFNPSTAVAALQLNPTTPCNERALRRRDSEPSMSGCMLLYFLVVTVTQSGTVSSLVRAFGKQTGWQARLCLHILPAPSLSTCHTTRNKRQSSSCTLIHQFTSIYTAG